MSQIRLDGRVAIITGAGAGLGRSHALELARRGALVVVNDLGTNLDGSGNNVSAADAVVAEITNAGGKAAASHDTVSTREGAENIIKTALDAFGKIDIVINNAGIVRDHSFVKMTDDEWDSVMAVHMKGTFNVTRAAWPVMRDNNYGRVIFTSSGVGLYGNFGQANYATAKMGMVGLMNVLKIEGAKNNILVNSIAPNAASRMTQSLFPPNILEKLKPEFISPLVAYLVSDQCRESGMIFNCMMGWYSRTAIMCSDGVVLGDGKREITAEEIMENWDRITSLDGAKPQSTIANTFAYPAPVMK
ncbi:MAG TPA: SDR family oxidoreductase [Spirochaetota bacterium]|nr:SDR family oxidoreductase [Spirochaetota bacterium]HPC43371.1 SDR family oxidoreductase [Spirochaetota bacterium]HPL16488.1 SDR family oxidoreductase [Spirochaetota bacterium]HQF09241.1 SDR family oxidoreductase [Spirochaetota bacterium]HQH97782.1 SDR family oxidoreductase [Spirochaetota bacterium]